MEDVGEATEEAGSSIAETVDDAIDATAETLGVD